MATKEQLIKALQKYAIVNRLGNAFIVVIKLACLIEIAGRIEGILGNINNNTLFRLPLAFSSHTGLSNHASP